MGVRLQDVWSCELEITVEDIYLFLYLFVFLIHLSYLLDDLGYLSPDSASTYKS